MAMLALIDADIVAYRCAASCKPEDPEWVSVARAKALMSEILLAVQAHDYKAFLSGDKNFRHDIYPAYKANRVQPKPKHLAITKQYLVDHWNAVVCDGIEADDALGIAQTESIMYDNPEVPFDLRTIICSIDKDLKMIPGMHYNFVKFEFETVSENDALRRFYTSMLVGDPADNIKGVPGIGKAKAPRILDGCETEEEMCGEVRSCYEWDDINFKLNADLLWIWRKPNDRWSLNRGKSLLREVDQPQESTQSMQEVLTESTALGTTK